MDASLCAHIKGLRFDPCSRASCWNAPEQDTEDVRYFYFYGSSAKFITRLPLFRRLPRPSRLQFQRSFLNWYRHSSRLRRTDSRSVSAKPGSLRQSLFCRLVRVICSHCFRWALPVGASLENGPGKNTKGSRPVSLGVKRQNTIRNIRNGHVFDKCNTFS